MIGNVKVLWAILAYVAIVPKVMQELGHKAFVRVSIQLALKDKQSYGGD